MVELFSIVLALVMGILLVNTADPVRGMGPRWAEILFSASLGTGAGIGVSSVLFLFLTVAGCAMPAAVFSVDAVLIGVLIALYLRALKKSAKRPIPEETFPGFQWTWALAVALGITLLIVFSRLVRIAEATPAGQWDAWAIWNLRAKFLAGPGDSWRYAVSPLLVRTHPDYPLLLSSFVARVWKSSGATNSLAPITAAFVFFGGVIALLVTGLALFRGAASALLAGLVLVSTTPLLLSATAQYSDIPVAFYCLATVALLFVDALGRSSRRLPLLWAGLCAGFAAWTKNEGIVFLTLVMIVFFAVAWRERGMKQSLQRSLLLFLGAAPGIVLTLWFKFFLAPASDPLVKQGISGVRAKLLEGSRYAEIAKSFVEEFIHLGSGVGHPLILLAILAIVLRWRMDERYKLPVRMSAIVLGLMFLSYCGVYLITPSDLSWQLQTSFGRLILQIWPSCLLLCFAVLGRVVDNAPPLVAAKVTTSPGSAARSRKKKVKTKQ